MRSDLVISHTHNRARGPPCQLPQHHGGVCAVLISIFVLHSCISSNNGMCVVQLYLIKNW